MRLRHAASEDFMSRKGGDIGERNEAWGHLPAQFPVTPNSWRCNPFCCWVISAQPGEACMNVATGTENHPPVKPDSAVSH